MRGEATVRRVEVRNDSGTVTLQPDGSAPLRLHLIRERGGWTVSAMEPIPEEELGSGYSVRRGGFWADVR